MFYLLKFFFSLTLDLYIYYRFLFAIYFNFIYLAALNTFFLLLSSFDMLPCMYIYADDDVMTGNTPGLLDKFVDRRLSDFWWLINHGVPCSPNFDLDLHTDLSFSSLVKDFYPQPLDIRRNVYEVPYGAVRFGFEEVYLYKNQVPDFIGLKISYMPSTPTSVVLDFGDYMLGRPRTYKETFELLGFALSAFCGCKALEAYFLQHGYFRLFIKHIHYNFFAVRIF